VSQTPVIRGEHIFVRDVQDFPEAQGVLILPPGGVIPADTVVMNTPECRRDALLGGKIVCSFPLDQPWRFIGREVFYVWSAEEVKALRVAGALPQSPEMSGSEPAQDLSTYLNGKPSRPPGHYV